MKKVLCILVGLYLCQYVYCQKRAPEWVKQILTTEEINMMQTVYAHYDSIDWSPLKEIAFNRTRLDTMLTRIKRRGVLSHKHPHKIRGKEYSCVVVLPQAPKSPVAPIQYCKGDTTTATYLAYSQIDNYDAHIMIDIAYRIIDEKLELIRFDYRGYSLAGHPVKFIPIDKSKVTRIKKADVKYTSGAPQNIGGISSRKKIKDFEDLEEYRSEEGKHIIIAHIQGDLIYRDANFKEQTESVHSFVKLELP